MRTTLYKIGVYIAQMPSNFTRGIVGPQCILLFNLLDATSTGLTNTPDADRRRKFALSHHGST